MNFPVPRENRRANLDFSGKVYDFISKINMNLSYNRTGGGGGKCEQIKEAQD
jgi:hypothetical protein